MLVQISSPSEAKEKGQCLLFCPRLIKFNGMIEIWNGDTDTSTSLERPIGISKESFGILSCEVFKKMG